MKESKFTEEQIVCLAPGPGRHSSRRGLSKIRRIAGHILQLEDGLFIALAWPAAPIITLCTFWEAQVISHSPSQYFVCSNSSA